MQRRGLMAREPSYFFGSSRCFRWPAARRLTARQRYGQTSQLSMLRWASIRNPPG